VLFLTSVISTRKVDVLNTFFHKYDCSHHRMKEIAILYFVKRVKYSPCIIWNTNENATVIKVYLD